MKIIFRILALSFFVLSIICCKPFPFSEKEYERIFRAQEEMRNIPRSRHIYMNQDFSRNIYRVDSIKLNEADYIILKSPVNKHAFVVSKDVWYNEPFSEKALLSNPAAYLLAYEMDDMTWR